MLFPHGGDERRRRLPARGDAGISLEQGEAARLGEGLHGAGVIRQRRRIRLRPLERPRREEEDAASARGQFVQQFAVGLAKGVEPRRTVERFDLSKLRDHHRGTHALQLLPPAAESLATPAFADGALEINGVPVPGEVAKFRARVAVALGQRRFEASAFLRAHHVRAADESDDITGAKFELLRGTRGDGEGGEEEEGKEFHGADACPKKQGAVTSIFLFSRAEGERLR